MKFFTKIILLSLLFITIQAEQIVNIDLSTEDIENPSILNSLGPVEILNLSGYYNVGKDIQRFKIISLPNPSEGILYLEDGETEVQVNQILNTHEANTLRFDPNPDFVGDATFQYASVNSKDEVDPTPATVTIPVYAKEITDVNGTTSTPKKACSCDNYDSSPSMSLWGVFVMMILTLIITRKEFNEDF